ncbi:MAG: hypothetical protein HY906_10230 [Deltaproteobacteria bacterium]|nr:hypothetical protein [Deltaproteobacteria bacterium]
MRPTLTTLAAAAILAAVAPARAEVALGYIVRIDLKGAEAEVYIDLGVERGALEGNRVTLLRDITVRHPITKRPLRDLFPVAEAKIESARGNMSILRLPAATAKVLRPGDRAALGAAPAPTLSPEEIAAAPGPARRTLPCPAPKEKACPACPQVKDREPDAATQGVLQAWRATFGQTPDTRIALWRDYAKRFPSSPYGDFAREEAKRIRVEMKKAVLLLETQQAAAASAEALRQAQQRAVAQATQTYHQKPDEVRRGEPVEVAVSTAPQPQAALLHYREPGAPRLTTVRLQGAGDGYYRGTIPGRATTGTKLAYSLETVDENGQRQHAAGTEGEPTQVAVRENPRAADLANRSRIMLRSEYVDFNSFRREAGSDYYWILEGDFTYRFRTILHSMNLGFGTYNGVGGKFDKQNLLVGDSRTIGFNYAHAGLEFRFHELFSVITKVLVGLNQDGLAAGFEGRIRIGREEGTNLVLGAQTAKDIGTLGLIQLTWDVVRDFPMSGTVEVTDQPAQGDIGVRFSYDIGWRALKWWYPSLRVSFQARTIDHYGFGAGEASTFAW